VEKPSALRRLAATAIDVGLLFLVAPCLAIGLGVFVSWVIAVASPCGSADPCDGPGIIGFGLALYALLATWLLYWPLLVLWRGRTVGSRLVGLRFEGKGLHRRLVWESGRSKR
jgi:uncharacterized RDD family membrane protein YckC